ncbi:MAG: tetratricopeptide repeat protein [Candidatus Riflebacteria bacterium]|nr:tetratricopeptide repeat protein [Candidatus Riflebacteria bacterium]
MFYNNYKSLTFILLCSLLLSTPSYSQNVFANSQKSEKSNSAAFKILQNTLKNNPDSITAKLACAKVYMKNENYAEAEELIMQVLEKEPTNSKANKLLKELNKLYSNHIDNLNNPETSEIKAVTAIPSKVEQPVEEEKPIEKKIEEKPKQIEPIISQSKKEEINKFKLPTKEEILKRAKAKKQAESIPTDNNDMPMAIQAPKVGKLKTANISEEPKATEKSDFIEPIIITPQTSDEEISTKEFQTEKKTLNNEDGSLENYKFKPFIANQHNQNRTQELKSLLNEKKEELSTKAPTLLSAKNFSSRNNEIIENTSKEKFLERVSSSFLINLDEAYCKIESNKLEEASLYLDIATTLAVAEKDNKKLLDAQLTRAVIYIYQCNFEKYGTHILSLRKGVSDDVYNSLRKIYETGIKQPSESSKLSYASNLAYDSGHYLTALELAKKINPQDTESRSLIEKINQELNKINGEYLLNKGSYMYALDFFEKENDEAEKGRTYLAISKTLLDSNENRESAIAEQFGQACLFKSIKDDPNNPKANLYLALYFLDKGDKNQAKEAIRRGLNAQGENDIITSKLLNLSENL